MAAPKSFNHLLERNNSGVKINLQGFGVIAHRLISWPDHFATGVSNPSTNHAIKTPELGVGSPESAQRESECLQFAGDFGVDRWAKIKFVALVPLLSVQIFQNKNLVAQQRRCGVGVVVTGRSGDHLMVGFDHKLIMSTLRDAVDFVDQSHCVLPASRVA